MHPEHRREIPGAKILLAACLLLLAAAAAGSEKDFLAAHDAYRARDPARLENHARRLQGHLLAPYVNYWRLQLQIEEADPAEIKQFLLHHSDTPLADRLRGEWLKVLGKQQNWRLFLSEYPALVSSDSVLVCYALQARQSQGDRQALEEARSIWFSGIDAGGSCAPLYEIMHAEGGLTAEDVWTRLRIALEAGNIGTARRTMQYLPQQQTKALAAVGSAAENPQQYLAHGNFDFSSRGERELAMFALHRLARNQPREALAYWEEMREHFSEAEQGYVWGQLAYHAARKHDPDALAWFKKAAGTPLNDAQLEWKVRATLRQQNWAEVLEGIQALPETAQRQDTWRYWKGRALKAQGKPAQANTIFAPLSAEHSFYGQLAGEELGTVISNPPVAYKPGEEEIKAVQDLPGIQRALALYQLNLRLDAVREWVWAIRGFDDRRLLAAAELARRNEWYDRAINTAERTRQLHDFSLRYPAPHRELMQAHAGQLQLDEAWVYGLIRQESRFISQARSSVGATGIMQLMPATAKWIAKRLGIKKRPRISQVDTNIAFGTYYLKYVLENLEGNPVLATAAYNAGPVRARRWRDEQPMEGAIYVESIPFTETRDYVKKVMSNAGYYERSFGQRPLSLKQRLGVIAGGTRECEAKDERSPSCEP